MSYAGRGALGVAFALGLAPNAQAADAQPIDTRIGVPPLAWRATTASPNPLPAIPSKDPLFLVCGAPDAALTSVAARNAARQRRGEASFGSDELGFTLRASGAPYVWPRAWTMKGKAMAEEQIEAELQKFVAKAKTVGERRCGLTRIRTRDGGELVSVVLADVLADVQPVPTLARVGDWITLRGTMKVPASDAKVVLLGPRGAPGTVLASLSGDDLRATFNVDKPGAWLIQVVATTSSGPRPVMELEVHAGTLPPQKFAELEVPGDDAAPAGARPEEALYAMVNAARVAEGEKPLMRDSSLDKLAIAHSLEMRKQRSVGHDVGDGDVGDRIAAAGIVTKRRGENVASAASVVRAHRALWLSPSHRANLLDARFTRVGVGVETGDDGRVWVTQVFAD